MRPDLLTFDCYGTLIDWRSGVLGALRGSIPDARSTPDDAIFAAFAEIESVIEAGDYRPYRQVLAETALGLAERFAWSLPPGAETCLADTLPDWPPFPEVDAALQRLRQLGFRLAILSNVDDDLLRGTLRHFSVTFDLLVTAQQVRSYKPRPAHFQRALEAVGAEPHRILHIAQSYYHDVSAAPQLGIPVLWVNRTGATVPAGGPRPVAEVGNLDEAVAQVEALSAAS